MCEPLRGKINTDLIIYSDHSNFGDRTTILGQYQKLASDIKSAVKFYIKYKNNPPDDVWKLFTKEYPNLKDKITHWDKWFYNYVFADVIEDET